MNQETYENRNKKRQEYQNQEKRNSNSSRSVRSHEHLKYIRRCPKILEVRILGRRSDLVSVCVKRNVFVHNNNVNNKNMITEIKDDRIINIKNKTMNDIYTSTMTKRNNYCVTSICH